MTIKLTHFLGFFPDLAKDQYQQTAIDAHKKMVDFLVTYAHGNKFHIKWIKTGAIEFVTIGQLNKLKKSNTWANDF